ncbi:MAG: TrmO family methyltransferase [Egibacteraceae bacterium]
MADGWALPARLEAPVTYGQGDELHPIGRVRSRLREVAEAPSQGDEGAGQAWLDLATRSPHRPNPIGLHAVDVLEVGPHGLRVAPLEAVDGTPVLDVKPALLGQPWGRPRSPWREEGGGV